MTTDEVANVVRDASKKAVVDYLLMCGLDSPWEVPEAFLASEAAKALHAKDVRVAIEFRLDRANNAPTRTEITAMPARLQRAYAHLDVAIFKSEPDPWALTLDGIVEFKKHSSLADDAALIEFMRKEKLIAHGVLALFVVGGSPASVEAAAQQLMSGLTEWNPPQKTRATEYPAIPHSKVGGRWWDICCLVVK